MIESTASRGAGVTSSGTGTLSTRQLGAKHSITKRFIRRARREVRDACMAHPRRVRAVRAVLSSLVARGLTGHFSKERPSRRSWLKSYGSVRANPSAPRPAPCPTRAAPASSRPRGPRRCPLGPAHQRPAGADHGGQAGRDRGGAADGCAVCHKDDRDDGAAESCPSNHFARGVARRGVRGGARRLLAAVAGGSGGEARALGPPAAPSGCRGVGRSGVGRSGVGRRACGRRPRRPPASPCGSPAGGGCGGAGGRGCGHGNSWWRACGGGAGEVRRGCAGVRRTWRVRLVGGRREANEEGCLPVTAASSSCGGSSGTAARLRTPRLRSDRGSGVVRRVCRAEACTVQAPLPYGACSCMLPGTHAPWPAGSRTPGLWAGEEWRRTLGGMGLGR